MGLSINDTAPDFEADTTQGRISFHEWIASTTLMLLAAARGPDRCGSHKESLGQ